MPRSTGAWPWRRCRRTRAGPRARRRPPRRAARRRRRSRRAMAARLVPAARPACLPRRGRAAPPRPSGRRARRAARAPPTRARPRTCAQRAARPPRPRRRRPPRPRCRPPAAAVRLGSSAASTPRPISAAAIAPRENDSAIAAPSGAADAAASMRTAAGRPRSPASRAHSTSPIAAHAPIAFQYVSGWSRRPMAACDRVELEHAGQQPLRQAVERGGDDARGQGGHHGARHRPAKQRRRRDEHPEVERQPLEVVHRRGAQRRPRERDQRPHEQAGEPGDRHDRGPRAGQRPRRDDRRHADDRPRRDGRPQPRLVEEAAA